MLGAYAEPPSVVTARGELEPQHGDAFGGLHKGITGQTPLALLPNYPLPAPERVGASLPVAAARCRPPQGSLLGAGLVSSSWRGVCPLGPRCTVYRVNRLAKEEHGEFTHAALPRQVPERAANLA